MLWKGENRKLFKVPAGFVLLTYRFVFSLSKHIAICREVTTLEKNKNNKNVLIFDFIVF